MRKLRLRPRASLALAIGLIFSPVAAFAGSSTSASVFTVTIAGDSGQPGSLRAALVAADAGSGPSEITFSPSLDGQTITLRSPLPPITRDGVELVGSNVTISGAQLGSDQGGPLGLIDVLASQVTIRGLTFVSIPDGWAAILVRGGKRAAQSIDGPQQISDIRIDHDNFLGAGGSVTAWGVSVGTAGPDGGQNVTISSLWIGHNTFAHFRGDGDAILLGIGTSNNTISTALIHDNTITDTTFAVELAPGSTGTGNRISGVRILDNSFDGNFDSININNGNPGSNGNTVEHTLVEGNVVTNGGQDAVDINGGHDGANGNTISDTQLVNNVFASQVIINGGSGSSTGNQITGLGLTNDTIVGPGGPAMDVAANALGTGASGNSINGLLVTNTIIDGNINGDTPTMVSSLVSRTPGFVGPSDYHLAAGSPAINAGTSVGAPSTDLEGRARSDGHPDIGAYEFGGATRPALTVDVTDTGGATGEITSSPAGIDCPTLCASGFDAGATVTLTATAWPGATFTGWSGACSGTSTCTITADAAKSVAAVFAPTATAPVVQPKPKPLPKCKRGQRSTKKKPCHR